MSVHSDCQYYVFENDMCLLYFEFGFFDVSQYHTCLEEKIYGEKR